MPIIPDVPREILDSSDLSPAEREEFDYLDWKKIDAGEDSASFVRYGGDLYSLDQFMRVEENGHLSSLGWTGYHADSAFSAILIRIVTVDGESLAIMGRYYE